MRATHGFALTIALVSLGLGAALADVEGGKHDFTPHGSAEGDGEGAMCQPCHIPHRPGPQPLWSEYSPPEGSPARSMDSLCLGCHDGVALRRISEPGPGRAMVRVRSAKAPRSLPLGDKGEIQCTTCHDPHSNNAMALRTSDPAGVCLDCHGDAPAEGAKPAHEPIEVVEVVDERAHVPFRERNCASCHKKGEAADEAARSCNDCHGDMKPPEPPARVHPLVAKAECGACHMAHTSPQPYLLRLPATALCTQCHEELDHSRVEGANSACLSCHSPHGGVRSKSG